MGQDSSECLEPDLTFPDMLVTVDSRAERRLRIVHVHDLNAIKPDCPLDRLQSGLEPLRGGDVPTRCKQVRRVEAYPHRQVPTGVKD